MLANPGRTEVGIVDQESAPGTHHLVGVESLLTIADREGNVGRGQSDCRQLGDGHRPRSA